MRRLLALVALLLPGVALAACESSDASSDGARDADAGDGGGGDAASADGAGDAARGADADAGAASPCPAGSKLLADRRACVGAGAPLATPPALASALASASPGDVVSMAGLDEGNAPCLPVVTCTPDDAPSMLFSDDPESPSADGVLYADTPPVGRHRIYVYHANGGAAPRKFPVVVLNQGAADATVTIRRRGVGGPSQAYVGVGKAVLASWLAAMTPIVVTVPAGQRVLLDPLLDSKNAAQNDLVHAIYDVDTSAPLKLSVVSVLAGADAAATAGGLSLLPRDAAHVRGTFAAADVLVVAEAGAAKRGVSHLRLGGGVLDADLEGADATTGAKVKLGGNYGVLYLFQLFAPGVPASPAALAPRGGGWGGVFAPAGIGGIGGAGGAGGTGGAVVKLPAASETLATTTDAIALGALAPGAALLSAGGSNLPVDVFLATP